MSDPHAEPTPREPERISDKIGGKAERKIRARRQEDKGVWFGLGMFGLVGWAVAVPHPAGHPARPLARPAVSRQAVLDGDAAVSGRRPRMPERLVLGSPGEPS